MNTESYNQQAQQATAPFITSTESNNDLIRLALQSGDILDDLQIKLLNLEFDVDRRAYVEKKYGTKALNENGVMDLMTLLSSLINRNTTLSNIDDEFIRETMKSVSTTVNDAMLNNYFSWGIKKESWGMIMEMATNTIHLSLHRAKDGIERNILGGGTKTLIQKSEVASNQRISESKSGGIELPKIFRGG